MSDRTSLVMSCEFGKELEEIFHVNRIKSAVFNFDCGEPVTATVEFFINEAQCKAILQLFQDGKWRSPDDVGGGS